jgi:hypothetical protein
MIRRFAFRSLVAALGAFLLSSCSDAGLTSPPAPVQAAWSQSKPEAVGPSTVDLGTILGSPKAGNGLELHAIWWKKDQKQKIRVSKTIDASGGVIVIPETGLTLLFPRGAVERAITVTITADEKYVAYKMEPSGTRFLKDVVATQLLNPTAVFGSPLRTPLLAAYIADDNIKLSGKVPVLEIEPSRTIFSGFPPLPQAHVWIIRHFSRYMLASN